MSIIFIFIMYVLSQVFIGDAQLAPPYSQYVAFIYTHRSIRDNILTDILLRKCVLYLFYVSFTLPNNSFPLPLLSS